MRRVLRFGAGLVVGIVIGGGAVLLTGASPVQVPSVSSTLTVPVTTPVPATTVATAAALSMYLVWTPGGLPADLAAGIGDMAGVSAVSVVKSDLVDLTASRDALGAVIDQPAPGLVIPVEVASIDSNLAELVPVEWHDTIANVAEDGLLLTESSASVRQLGAGGTLVLKGSDLRVEAVVPDVVLGAAEIVVTNATGESLGVTTPRYLLVAFTGDRADFERQVRALLPSVQAVRIRAPGETPFLRQGDAVLPQVMVKDTFGEFAIREVGGGEFEIDRDWTAANLTTEEVPLIGAATCHVGVMSALRSAMSELEQANLGFLVETFHGCWNPRFIGGTRSISRHAWGVAVDINYQANVTGQTTTQDARLVETMERWGFTWGGNWLVPDAAHFEWVSPPRP